MNKLEIQGPELKAFMLVCRKQITEYLEKLDSGTFTHLPSCGWIAAIHS